MPGLHLCRESERPDRPFHILPQASSNHLPIAAKKPRLAAALPCMPIADILRPTHGTYLLDAWYIPHHMTVSRSKPWSIPPEREKCMFYVELTSFGTDIFCHKATKKFIFYFQPREWRMKVASFWRAPFVAAELRSRGRR